MKRPLLGLVSGALGAAGLILLTPTIMGAAGYSPTIVRGNSMVPALYDGDAIFTRDVVASSVSVGDVVTFPDPEAGHITHRVVDIERSATAMRFVTRGDASIEAERWSVAPDDRLGLHAFRIPQMGRIAAAISSPSARAAGLALLIAFLTWKGAREGQTLTPE